MSGIDLAELERLEREAADAEAAAAVDIISPLERRAAAARKRKADALATLAEKQREAALIDLEEREAAARKTLGEKVPVRSLMSEDGAHSFVIKHAGSKAFNTWNANNGLAFLGEKDPATKKKITREENNKAYALLLVHDWNGKVVTQGSKEQADLAALFDDQGGMASAICMVGHSLAGAALEARKS